MCHTIFFDFLFHVHDEIVGVRYADVDLYDELDCVHCLIDFNSFFALASVTVPSFEKICKLCCSASM